MIVGQHPEQLVPGLDAEVVVEADAADAEIGEVGLLVAHVDWKVLEQARPAARRGIAVGVEMHAQAERRGVKRGAALERDAVETGVDLSAHVAGDVERRDPSELLLGLVDVAEAEQHDRVEQAHLSQVGVNQQDALEGGGGPADVALGDLGAGKPQIELEVVGIGQHVLVADRRPREGVDIERLTGGLPRLFGLGGLALELVGVGRLRPTRRGEQQQPGKRGDEPA